MKVDAIVNPTNKYLFPSGGTDLLIHNAAGPELYEECKRLGGCDVGSAKITPAFRLPCRFVIHTVGPVWHTENEPERLLVSCYKSCLELAKEKGCESMAFPLISSGSFGFPKDQVLKIAMSTISTFLFDNEMMVYLLVYDRQAYELSEKLFSGIESYIDDNYVLNRTDSRREKEYILSSMTAEDADMCCDAPLFEKSRAPAPERKSLEDSIKLDEGFALKLLKLIDAKGISDVECYKKANVSKQTWHKLMTDKSYKPNKKTAIAFAVALELSLNETQKLLSSVGFILSDSSLFDVIIKYCLENGIYDVFEIDSALYKYVHETLFYKV